MDTFPPYVEIFDDEGERQELWEKTGTSVEKFGSAGSVTIDNSAGVVYVSQEDANTRNPVGVGKFNTSGVRVNFECSKAECPYIEGSEIIGTPNGAFPFHKVAAVTTDAEGNIYVVDNEYENNVAAVVEYRPNGEFVHAFTGGETPGLGESREGGGFGGRLESIAVDPVTGLVIVSVSHNTTFEGGESNLGAVDEFVAFDASEPASGRFVNQITETSGGRSLESATSVATDGNGDLYVVDNKSIKASGSRLIDEYGPGGFTPNFKFAEVTELSTSSVTLNALVNPESNREVTGLSECYFEYVDRATYEKEGFIKPAIVECEPSAAEISKEGEQDSYHLVHAKIESGIVSGTSYYYRLAGRPGGALGAVGYSGPLKFTAPAPPTVVSSSASNISAEFAEFHANVAVVGAGTSYYFEYGTTTAYGNDAPVLTAEAPNGDGIGSGGSGGSEAVNVVQWIGGLTPSTTYYFRAVARSTFRNGSGREGNGLAYGKSEMFTTMPAPIQGLPDGRAYELVTPPDKGSAEDMFGARELVFHEFYNIDFGYAAESGNQFLLETGAAFGPYPVPVNNPSAPDGGHNAYVFSRSVNGWQTVPFGRPSLGVQSVFADVFDPEDFSRLGIRDEVGAELGVAGVHTASLIATLDSPISGPMFTQLPSDVGSGEPTASETKMVGSSRNLDHIVVETKDHTLVPAPGDDAQDPSTTALYEAAGGQLTLVNVNSEGVLLNRCGAGLGQGSGLEGASHGAVSADGSKIFFTAPDPSQAIGSECWDHKTEEDAPQLYMRSGGETTQLSMPEDGVTEEGSREEDEAPVQHPAIYVGASENGSRVFFVTETEMTREAAELKLHDPELYEYNTEGRVGKRLTRVSRGELGSAVAEGSPAEVYVVEAVSAEGTSVYFAAFGQLAQGAPAVTGEEVNLYDYDTRNNRTTYVTTIDERDYPSNSKGWWTGRGGRLVREIAVASDANWYTTPDGNYLLFATTRQLTRHSTAAATPADCPPVNVAASPPNGDCLEIYRYDAMIPLLTGREAEGVQDNPACLSCDPSGSAPSSNAFFGHSAGLDTSAAGPVRAMSSNGMCAFFDSADPLVTQVVNGTNNVYEWEARGAYRCRPVPGASGCQLPQGCVYLIDAGAEAAPSYFLGASSDGSNVFFGTHEPLVRQDTDTAGDVYDARICEPEASNPCLESPPGETAQCEGTACQSPPSEPIDATPASLTFAGSGNVAGRPVAKARRLTVAQMLATALAACRKGPKGKRRVCEARARKRYRRISTKGKKAGKKPVNARHTGTAGRRSGR